jgi:hypothetical protein
MNYFFLIQTHSIYTQIHNNNYYIKNKRLVVIFEAKKIKKIFFFVYIHKNYPFIFSLLLVLKNKIKLLINYYLNAFLNILRIHRIQSGITR